MVWVQDGNVHYRRFYCNLQTLHRRLGECYDRYEKGRKTSLLGILDQIEMELLVVVGN